VFFDAQRPCVREALIHAVIDEEIECESEKLPDRRECRVLGPHRDCEIQGQYRQIGRQHPVEPVAVELPQPRPLPSKIRPQKLRCNQIAAQDKEKIDSHPAQARGGNQKSRQRSVVVKSVDVKNDDGKDGQAAQCVQTMGSRGG